MTSLNISLPSFQLLEPVHHLILDHLSVLAPVTTLRLSRYHHRRLLPQIYAYISMHESSCCFWEDLLLRHSSRDDSNTHHSALDALRTYTKTISLLDARSILCLSALIEHPSFDNIQSIQIYPHSFEAGITLYRLGKLIESAPIREVIATFTPDYVQKGSPGLLGVAGLFRPFGPIPIDSVTFQLLVSPLTNADWRLRPLEKALYFFKCWEVEFEIRVVVDLGCLSQGLPEDTALWIAGDLAVVVRNARVQSQRFVPLKFLLKYEGDEALVEAIRGHAENRLKDIGANGINNQNSSLSFETEEYWREFVELRKLKAHEAKELLFKYCLSILPPYDAFSSVS
ncbi:hypothetical protein I350_02591 [Cryptococcus amylolentus CBS 6273]|uniref:Uncharacterized protein n=1 Tax=Cryptococcus amylolentus CBS 6273 TaxID=1296118 RepID=A0A1E3K720_9TREE|nr:hypothetical protein I350_02591 [Cryptococcus amylolentus CBS 6273]